MKVGQRKTSVLNKFTCCNVVVAAVSFLKVQSYKPSLVPSSSYNWRKLTVIIFVFSRARRRDRGDQTVRSGRPELRRRAHCVAATGFGVRGQRADDHRTGQRQQRAVPGPGRRRRSWHRAVPYPAVRVRYRLRRQRLGLAHVDGKSPRVPRRFVSTRPNRYFIFSRRSRREVCDWFRLLNVSRLLHAEVWFRSVDHVKKPVLFSIVFRIV